MIFRKKTNKKYKYNIIHDTISQKYIKLQRRILIWKLNIKLLFYLPFQIYQQKDFQNMFKKLYMISEEKLNRQKRARTLNNIAKTIDKFIKRKSKRFIYYTNIFFL